MGRREGDGGTTGERGGRGRGGGRDSLSQGWRKSSLRVMPFRFHSSDVINQVYLI